MRKKIPDKQRTILAFGDSITWGCVPDSVNLKRMTFERFGRDERWGGVLESVLGSDYRVIEEGLNGRTTVFDDPLLPGRNGQTYRFSIPVQKGNEAIFDSTLAQALKDQFEKVRPGAFQKSRSNLTKFS